MNERLRFRILSFCIFFSFGLASIRLFHITIFPDDRLKTSYTRSFVPRGNIYDRRGRLLAGISSSRSLFARPARIPNELKIYIKNYLHSTGYFSENELAQFDKNDRNFVYVKRDMTPSITAPVTALLRALKNEGYLRNDELGLTSEESRFYPYDFLSPIIGTLGRDSAGLYGIEYTLNSSLEQGFNITSTLDAEISRIAYEELNKVVADSQAQSGSVAIMDLKKREILALVQAGESQNQALSTAYIYEPGSVMKIFTAAFAMEQGIASTSEPKFDDYTSYKVGDYIFSKPSYGYIPLSVMIQKSANISFARLAGKFGSDDYYLWLSELGFGQKPKLPLTGLEKGILHPVQSWNSLSKPMIAIGQEIGVTTLQLLIAASVIAGGGEFISPIIVSSIQNNAGEETLAIEREYQQLMHPQKARELLYALEKVVMRGGTGNLAAIDGIRIAGKTGTGMIAGHQGYSVGQNNTVFIGFLPVEDPHLAIVAAVHNPKGQSRSGGGVSAPLFADITRRILLYANINATQ